MHRCALATVSLPTISPCPLRLIGKTFNTLSRLLHDFKGALAAERKACCKGDFGEPWLNGIPKKKLSMSMTNQLGTSRETLCAKPA